MVLQQRLRDFAELRWAIRAAINKVTWSEAQLCGPVAYTCLVLQVGTQGDWACQPSVAAALCCVCKQIRAFMHTRIKEFIRIGMATLMTERFTAENPDSDSD